MGDLDDEDLDDIIDDAIDYKEEDFPILLREKQRRMLDEEGL